MRKLYLDKLQRKKDYMIVKNEKFDVIFTNAENNRSFNRATEEGIKNISSIEDDFEVEQVIFLKQIHSDKIYIHSFKSNIKELEGDAIVTKEKNTAIGVFTADCVPIILVDETEGVVAAIHSGWRGTFNSITSKTIKKMQGEFGCKACNIRAFVGPHIRKCCYEVSEELKEKFIEKYPKVDKKELFNGRNLNLEICIEQNLKDAGINFENMFSLEMCTYCSKEVELFSYRKSSGAYGRMFAFVYLK